MKVIFFIYFFSHPFSQQNGSDVAAGLYLHWLGNWAMIERTKLLHNLLINNHALR